MIRAVDLFSGPGGLTLGLKSAGFDPILSVERKRDAVETYAAHTGETEHICGDIRKVDFSRYRGKADVVFGGPPCQPFSTGGLRQGLNDARDMFPQFVRAISEISPRAFLVENVPGLLTKGHVEYFQLILGALQAAGFYVSWKLLYAPDYGVPQKRKRLFIVGLREKFFRFPRPTFGPTAGVPYVSSGSILSKSQAIGEPPECPVIYAKYPDPRKSPYAGHVYNGGGRPVDLDAPCHTILASAGGYKTHWIDTLDIAPAYTASLLAGSEPREGQVPGARRLSVEESKLIQTFPADMWFAGSRSSQYTQIGDAVPPRLGAAIGHALAAQLEDKALSLEDFEEWEPRFPLFADA